MITACRKDASVRRATRPHGLVTGAWLLAALAVSTAAQAHHGFGRFDRTKPVEINGVIKSIDFVNPHSYLNLDVVGPDGKLLAMRCEMRAATLLRRSGWSEEMFVAGSEATIFGFGHRDDPASCYLEDITIGDASICRAGRGVWRPASRTSRATGRRSST
jgi:hypothetical protein